MERLPALNALLNGLAAVLLVAGWRAVRTGRVEAHKKRMLAAVLASAAFLTSYLVYHAVHGDTTFTATGWPRRIYFAILITHVPLAALMVPPILMLLYHGLKGRIDRHRRLARWTLPVWLYVSVTGVLIYFWLYQWYPPTR